MERCDLKYMCLAGMSYGEPDFVEEMSGEFGYQVLAFMSDGPAQSYLFGNATEAVLTYRGTEASKGDLWDIASNVRFKARKWEGPGKVHLGYARQYRRVRDELHALINAVPSSVPLIVTGHSLGGAVATIAAAHDMHVENWNFHRLITFGSPKCMDKEAHDAIICPHTRYVNTWDWAPLWPPSFTLGHWAAKTSISSGWGVSRHKPPIYIKAMRNHCDETSDDPWFGPDYALGV